MASWKRDFASGLIILVPLLVTVIFLLWIYNRLVQIPVPVESGPVRVALSIVIFVLLVFSVGYLMRTAVGSVLERAIDDLINQLPGLRVVYNASKMGVETALSGTDDLQAPVRLEVWDGLRMTAFKTGRQTKDGRDILFLPTAPNITSGFVIEVESDRYDEIDDTVEDALTRILSAGFGEKDNKSPDKSIRQLISRATATAPVETPVEDGAEPSDSDSDSKSGSDSQGSPEQS
ncbi:DUF502 domain-containing protein [Halobacteriaceae archaeon SHR40]|uniref:DUF502 domain-containing protein n=1 Tax=Halovenus amylolytica TaxID=2500550 RepID=UPI000FE3D115